MNSLLIISDTSFYGIFFLASRYKKPVLPLTVLVKPCKVKVRSFRIDFERPTSRRIGIILQARLLGLF